MSIKIEINHNFLQMEKILAEFGERALDQSTKRALNRTMVATRKESIKEIKARLNVRTGDLKRSYVFGNKAVGKTIRKMFALLKFSGRAIPLLTFVKGSKDRRNQQGIPVKRRRKLSVSIRPGRTVRLEHAFIARVKSKQVFNRLGKGKAKLAKRSVPSVGALVQSPKHRLLSSLAGFARRNLRKVFIQEFNARTKRAFKRARLRKA